MNNSIISRLSPKAPRFFELLTQVSEVLMSSTALLQKQLQSEDKTSRRDYFHQIKDLERSGDQLSNRIFDELSTSFITPFDREDIHLLADRLDDTIDLINSSAKRIAIYNPDRNNSYASSLAQVISDGAHCIAEAMQELSSIRKNTAQLKSLCLQLHRLENRADDLYEEAITRLFEDEKNAIELVKMKEILSELEKATDAAERVSKALKTIIVKYA